MNFLIARPSRCLATFGSASAAARASSSAGVARRCRRCRAACRRPARRSTTVSSMVSAGVERRPGRLAARSPCSPSRSHASSPRWGANGATSDHQRPRSARVARLTPPSASTFRYSISAAIAVLNCMRSRSAVTRLIVLWRRRRCGSSAGRLRRVPLLDQAPDALEEAVHALDGARIPGLGQLELAHEHLVEAHARRRRSRAMTSSGLTPFIFDFAIFSTGDLQLLAGRLEDRPPRRAARPRRARGSAPSRPRTSTRAPCPGGAASGTAPSS